MKNLKLLFALVPALIAVQACDAEELDSARLAAAENMEFRAAGSCTPEACGEYIPANSCQCDDACVDYGDCCDDVDAVCNAPVDECQSNEDCPEYCGWDESNTRVCKPWAQEGEQCQGFVLPAFRAECAPGLECEFSEPTHDVPGTCVDPNEGDFCGGIAAIQCPVGQHCELDGDYPDAGGTCHPGSGPGQMCGGIAGFQCMDGYACHIEDTFPDAAGTCVEECASAGCSGQVCTTASAAPNVITTCEFLPEYICFQQTTCGNFGPGGSCQWEQNDAYQACLDSFNEPAGNSCEGHCGGQADDGCYCDSLCSFYGDCCEDKVDVCG